MNEQLIINWLQPRQGNLIDRLAKIDDAETVANEVYLSILTRAPDENEMAVVVSFLNYHAARRQDALGELTWSLLTSAEFRLNH